MAEEKKFELTPSISIIIAGIIIAGAVVFTNVRVEVPQGSGEAPSTQTAVRAPQASEHRLGSKSAPIVLIEYADFECYYCGQAHPTLKRLVEESSGQIAWVYRHFPLESIHPQARPSALASECVAEQLGDEGFWKFADALFADRSKMSPDYYAEIAGQLGVNMGLYNACVQSEKFAAKVDADYAEAVKNGGQGTPWTVLWSSKEQVAVSGALPYAAFSAVIKSFQDRQ